MGLVKIIPPFHRNIYCSLSCCFPHNLSQSRLLLRRQFVPDAIELPDMRVIQADERLS